MFVLVLLQKRQKLLVLLSKGFQIIFKYFFLILPWMTGSFLV